MTGRRQRRDGSAYGHDRHTGTTGGAVAAAEQQSAVLCLVHVASPRPATDAARWARRVTLGRGGRARRGPGGMRGGGGGGAVAVLTWCNAVPLPVLLLPQTVMASLRASRPGGYDPEVTEVRDTGRGGGCGGYGGGCTAQSSGRRASVRAPVKIRAVENRSGVEVRPRSDAPGLV